MRTEKEIIEQYRTMVVVRGGDCFPWDIFPGAFFLESFFDIFVSIEIQ